MNNNKIAIIGGGVSGISAAVELSKAGIKSDIFEATNSLGGRVSSIYLKKVDETIDNGQHILVGSYKEFIRLLSNLGVKKTNLFEFNKINIEYKNIKGESFFLRSSFLENRNGFLWALLNTKLFTTKEKASILIFSQKLRFIDAKRYENAYQLLNKNGQNKNIITRLWEPLIISTMNTSSKIASPIILKNILVDSFFNSGNAGNLIIPKTDFAELISEPAKKYLEVKGSAIYFNSPVKNISLNNNLLTLETRDKKYDYDSIIITTPAFITNKIFPSLKIEVPDYNPIMSIYFWIKEKITSQNITSFLGTSSQWLFNRTQLIEKCSKELYSYQITISNPEKELLKSKDSEVINLINNELNDLYNTNIQIEEYKIIREMFATFAASENNNNKRPPVRTSYNGVYLAGDWVQNGYPSTLEGAAINGVKAARSYLQDISKL